MHWDWGRQLKVPRRPAYDELFVMVVRTDPFWYFHRTQIDGSVNTMNYNDEAIAFFQKKDVDTVRYGEF